MWDVVLLFLETYSAELGGASVIGVTILALWGRIKSFLGFTPKLQQVEITNSSPTTALQQPYHLKNHP